MLLAKHVLGVLASTVRYGARTGRVGVLLVVVLGAIAVILAFATSAAAPFVVYPFV